MAIVIVLQASSAAAISIDAYAEADTHRIVVTDTDAQVDTFTKADGQAVAVGDAVVDLFAFAPSVSTTFAIVSPVAAGIAVGFLVALASVAISVPIFVFVFVFVFVLILTFPLGDRR